MRKDGHKIKISDPMYTLVPYIMTKRYDAMNMIEVDVPAEPIQQYLNNKRKEGIAMSHMGIILAAYLRTAAEFECLNRFIMNKRIYQRNEFSVSMVVMKPGVDGETMSKMRFKMEDTIFDVNKTIDAYIAENRKPGENNSTDKLMRVLLSIPGLADIAVGLIKWADKHGLLPKSLIDASPFHNSLCITNLASIRTNFIYHHCYEFGTTSVFFAMGNMKEVPKRIRDEIVFEKCIPLGIVMDERICAGNYFAKVCTRLKQYLADPALLEAPPTVVNTVLA